MKKLLLLLILLFIASHLNAIAATRTASQSGNWNSNTTWGNNPFPVAGDDVIIDGNFDVTVTVPAACATLTINQKAKNNTPAVTISIGQTLTITGAILIESTGSYNGAGGATLDVGAGTLNAAGSTITLSGGSNTRVASLTISTGTANVGSITFTGTTSNSQLIFSGSGILNVSSALGTGGVFTASTGTVNFTANGPQTIPGYTFNNLTVSGSGTKTTTGVTVNGILSMEGTAAISAAPTFGAAATLQYKGSGNVTTTNLEFPNAFAGSGGLIIDQGAGNTVTLNANKTALTNINIKSGTLNLSTFTANRAVAGGALIIAGTLKLGGTSGGQTGSNFPTNYSTLTLTGGTVEYAAASGGQTIYAAPVYNILSLTNTSGTNTAGGNLTASGVKINAGAAFDANSRTITITGAGLAWNNSGTFIYGTSRVRMNGTAAQSMFGSTFYDLEIDNPAGVTLTSSDVVTHQFILTNGNLKLGNFDLTVSGSIVGAGSSKYIITDGTGSLIQNVGTSPVTFPVGFVASDYTPITFSNIGTVQNYNVRVRDVLPNLVTTGLYRQWIIKETNAGTTNLSLVTLTWTAASAGTLGAPATCDMVANITGSADSYDKIYSGLNGSTYSATTGSMEYPLQNITAGLYITLVGNNKILPVELSSFTSGVNGRDVSLNWSTKTEKNSNKFVIERTRAGNINWDIIGTVKAAALSNSPKYYSYTDKNVNAGNYQYRLKMIDNDGSFVYSKIVEAEVANPKVFELSQNYPNPFNPSTKINYSLPYDARVTLEVYNIIGEKVAQIVNENQSAGYYTVNFGSSSFNSGIYLYKLTTLDNTGKNFSSIKKMMLLK